MPQILITGNRFDQRIEMIQKSLNSPDLVEAIGYNLAAHLAEQYSFSGLEVRSGAALNALTYVGEAERVGGNAWTIGVGNREDLGEEDQPAPEGTLRAFFNDNPEIPPSPWKFIPPDYKMKLEQLRRMGMYGGRGPSYANYIWVQNNGSASAYIDRRQFIDGALMYWRNEAQSIADEWWKSIGFGGRMIRRFAGMLGR